MAPTGFLFPPSAPTASGLTDFLPLRTIFRIVHPLLDRFVPREGLRRDLWVSTADAAAYSVMVGCGETYIAAFALALGLGPVAAGMLVSVPILVGAFVQLVTPLGVKWVGSNREWVIACTIVQSLSFIPLVFWALRGHAHLTELLVAASVYWSAGMAGTPAWNTWMGMLVPQRMRMPYFTQRSRLSQCGVFVGFVVGGVILQVGESRGSTLLAFAVLFTAAGICRLLSTIFLAACSEPDELPIGKPRHPGVVAAVAAAELAARPTQTTLFFNLKHALATMAVSPSGALVAYLCSLSFSAQFAGPYFTPYMLRENDFSYSAFMLVASSSFLAKALVLPSVGRLGARIGSLRLLWIGGLAAIPLPLLWLPSMHIGYLAGVQVAAGVCWATYELAVALLFFEAVPHRERTGVVTVYNLGIAIATLCGAGAGGIVLQMLGEDTSAYCAVFAISSLLRVATIPLLLRVRVI